MPLSVEWHFYGHLFTYGIKKHHIFQHGAFWGKLELVYNTALQLGRKTSPNMQRTEPPPIDSMVETSNGSNLP